MCLHYRLDWLGGKAGYQRAACMVGIRIGRSIIGAAFLFVCLGRVG